MKLLPQQRREKIFNLIREDGHAKVLDLSKIFKVTEVTIRQEASTLFITAYIITLSVLVVNSISWPMLPESLPARVFRPAACSRQLISNTLPAA